MVKKYNPMYHIYSKYFDKQVCANSVDRLDAAERGVRSGSTLFAIHPAAFRHINSQIDELVQILG